MRRRAFITLIGSTAVAWPLTAHAQLADRVRRVGVLMPDAQDDPQSRADITAFRQELQNEGWAERNVRIDFRWSDGKADGARSAAAELLSLAPDVIVTDG